MSLISNVTILSSRPIRSWFFTAAAGNPKLNSSLCWPRLPSSLSAVSISSFSFGSGDSKLLRPVEPKSVLCLQYLISSLLLRHRLHCIGDMRCSVSRNAPTDRDLRFGLLPFVTAKPMLCTSTGCSSLVWKPRPVIAASTSWTSGLFRITLGTLARRGRVGRSGGRRSGGGGNGLLVPSLLGKSLLGTSLLVAPAGLETFRKGGWDPRPLVRKTPLVGTEAERFAKTSVAEVINSSGSLPRSQHCFESEHLRLLTWRGYTVGLGMLILSLVDRLVNIRRKVCLNPAFLSFFGGVCTKALSLFVSR